MPNSNEHIINLISGAPADLPPQHAKTSPVAAQGSKEHRSVPRFYVKWRTVAFVDAQNQHHGFIKDISTRGASVFLDSNLQSLEFIKLHIHVPPSHTSKASRLIEVYGKIVYTTHDINELLFRTGISFLKFESQHDPVFLEKYLTDFQTRVI